MPLDPEEVARVIRDGGYLPTADDRLTIGDIIARDPTAFNQNPNAFLQSQGIRIPTQINLDYAKSKAQRHLESINTNHKILVDVLNRHEATIRKRWEKKAGKRKKQVFVDAWPEIPLEHRSDWKALSSAAKIRGLEGPVVPPDPKYRDAFLMPHLNVEDLSAGKSLLVLFHTRARNKPEIFAINDYRTATLGIRTQAIIPDQVNGGKKHRVCIAGNDYGKILPHTESTSSIAFIELQHGLIILEIQDRTLEFLVKCAKGILHDIPEDELFSDTYPAQEPMPPISLYDPETETITIPTLAQEGPYQPPQAMDFDAILRLIEAKRNECENYMWELREDPGFFYETAVSRAEHRQESVRDLNGKEHPFKGTTVFWDRILTNVVQEAYTYLMSWTIVKSMVQRLKELHERYADSIAVDKPLPEELEVELRSYKDFIDLMQGTPVTQLNSAVPGSPEMRSDWIRDTTWPDPNVVKVKTKRPVLYDYLLMLFTVLSDDERRELMGLQNIIDEIERIIRRDANQKARISPMVAKMFSDLALTGELDRQLKMYQPRLYEPFSEASPSVAHAVNVRTLKVITPFMQVADQMDDKLGVAAEGTPTPSKFAYPVDKRRTQQNVDQMRKAESELDKFWEKVDKVVMARAGRQWRRGVTLHVLNPSLMTSVKKALQRTEPWVESPKVPKPTNQPTTSTADQQFELELRTQRTIGADTPTQAKTKTKTRGEPGNVTNRTNEQQTQENQDASPSADFFTVNRRAFKVFQTIFHSPSAPDRPGEIPWQDFLYAMSSVGFVIEKLYGSVWQFTPTKLDVERPINIHEPHPEKKIAYRIARRYGARFNRAYGWSAQMFRLE